MKNAVADRMAGNDIRIHGVNTLHSWSTASFGGPAEISSPDLSALGEHLGLCKSPHGHLFALHCAAQSMRGFMASRLVTTMVAMSLVVGIAAFVL